MTSMKDMPLIGLGTWLSDNEAELEAAVDKALELGYRHFDSAWIYGNEPVLGRALKRWLDEGRVTREELFIVTKLPGCGMTPEKVPHFINLSLQNLNLTFVDLYLIHVPFGIDSSDDSDPIPIRDGQVVWDMSTDLEGVWSAMEDAVGSGQAKQIGLSNCDSSQIARIVKMAKIPPAVLQVEMHVHFQQRELRSACSKMNIKLCAYSPLGSPGRGDFYAKVGAPFQPPSLLSDEVIGRIATKHGKSPGQVCLRFLMQQGIAAIPKSTNAQRLRQNIEALQFYLDEDDMTSLEALDKGAAGRNINFMTFLPGVEKHPEFPQDMKQPIDD